MKTLNLDSNNETQNNCVYPNDIRPVPLIILSKVRLGDYNDGY